MGPTCSGRCAIHRREAAASHVHCELVRRCRRRSRSRSSSSIRILTQQRTPSRPGRQSHSSVTTATRPPKKQSHIISQQCLQSLWSPWLKSRSKGTFGLTLPPNDASFSLYAVFSSRCCHRSELPVALAARATHQSRQPHAPRRSRATSYHSSVSSHSGHPG